jgi:hypothetical protein
LLLSLPLDAVGGATEDERDRLRRPLATEEVASDIVRENTHTQHQPHEIEQMKDDSANSADKTDDDAQIAQKMMKRRRR